MADITAAENGNGRVTLAILQTEMHRLQADVQSLSSKLDSVLSQQDGRIRSLEQGQGMIGRDVAALNKCQDDQERKIDDLQKLNSIWSAANTLMAILAGYLGFKP